MTLTRPKRCAQCRADDGLDNPDSTRRGKGWTPTNTDVLALDDYVIGVIACANGGQGSTGRGIKPPIGVPPENSSGNIVPIQINQDPWGAE